MPCPFFFHPDLPIRDHCRCRNSNGSCLEVSALQCMHADLSARGLYRRSGFSPCPEDMRLQIYKLFLTNGLVFPRFYNIFATLTRRSIAFSITTRPSRPDATSPDGGIGRRAGLKHQWSNPCRFDPGSGYPSNRKSLIFKDLRFFFWILHHGCTTGVWWIAGFLSGAECIFTGKLLLVPSFFGVSRAVSLCFCTRSIENW